MPLIFHNFPDEQRADDFVEYVRSSGLRARCWDSQTQMHTAWATSKDNGSADLADVFPFPLAGFVVTVERRDEEELVHEEDAVIEAVKVYGGEYAGT